jgi:hypothetical protein
MKTNVVMLSPDRELFGIKIRQESKTGHLNLSDLQAAYAVAREEYGWSEKRIDHILPQVENRERVYYLLKELNIINVDFHTFIEQVESQGIYKYLKACKSYRTTGARQTKTTWCNPYIWSLVAMELNPMLYAKTVIWLTDTLLLNRIEAGNMYRGLSGAIANFEKPDYAEVARALNLIVFGKHEAGIRQLGTAAELKELASLEENMSFAIKMGFIRTQDQLLDTLRNVWVDKFDSRRKAA